MMNIKLNLPPLQIMLKNKTMRKMKKVDSDEESLCEEVREGGKADYQQEKEEKEER